MTTELKIGIGLGIVVVVALVIFFAGGNDAAPEPEITLPGETAVVEPPVAPVEPEPAEEVVPPEPLPVKQPAEPQPEPEPEPAPTPEPVVEEPTPAKPRYHTVKANETLSSIAEKYYGQQRHWKSIHLANSDIIKDPHNIAVGVRLRIPSAKELAK